MATTGCGLLLLLLLLSVVPGGYGRRKRHGHRHTSNAAAVAGGGMALLQREAADFEPPWGRDVDDGGVCVVSACAGAPGAEDDLLVLFAGPRAAENRQFHTKPGRIDPDDVLDDDGLDDLVHADPSEPATGLLLSRHPAAVVLRHAQPRCASHGQSPYLCEGMQQLESRPGNPVVVDKIIQGNMVARDRRNGEDMLMAELARLLLHRATRMVLPVLDKERALETGRWDNPQEVIRTWYDFILTREQSAQMHFETVEQRVVRLSEMAMANVRIEMALQDEDLTEQQQGVWRNGYRGLPFRQNALALCEQSLRLSGWVVRNTGSGLLVQGGRTSREVPPGLSERYLDPETPRWMLAHITMLDDLVPHGRMAHEDAIDAYLYSKTEGVEYSPTTFSSTDKWFQWANPAQCLQTMQLVHRYSRNYTGMGIWQELAAELEDGPNRIGQPRWPQPSDMLQRGSAVNPTKIAHDLEQLEDLVRRGVVPKDTQAVDRYRHGLETVLKGLPSPAAAAKCQNESKEWYCHVHLPDGRLVPALGGPPLDRMPLGSEARLLAQNALSRRLHVMPPSRDWARTSVINPSVDWAQASVAYLSNDIHTIDELLTGEALVELREWCLQSTVWQDGRNGYVGAYRQGFAPPVLLRLAEQLHDVLPGILANHTLKMFWAHHYDSERNDQGIAPHVDEAAVNLNLWLTPAEANLEPERGGLKVWRKAPPALSQSAETYNGYNARQGVALRADLEHEPAVVIPHAPNRAVIFHSDLWHASDGARFRPGYRNRRINLTLLYGQRKQWRSSSES